MRTPRWRASVHGTTAAIRQAASSRFTPLIRLALKKRVLPDTLLICRCLKIVTVRTSLVFLMCALACAKGPAPGGAAPADARNVAINQVIPVQAPEVLERSLLGSQVGKDGVVTKDETSFPQGSPVHLTMVFRESPGGLVSTAEWMDSAETMVHGERRPMNGAKVATFTLETKRLKPGRYHVIGYWGGNPAADRQFEIVAPAKGKARKK